MKVWTFDPYILFLAFLTAIPAAATDVYLAAIPTIAKEWNISQEVASSTMSFFFICLSIGLLIYGPLSDKFGRKPILITSLLIFCISSFLCSIADNINQLLFFRIIQGLSASGPATLSMAITRDKFQGEERKRVLIYVGMVMAVVPMVAPTVGAYILEYYHWHIIFRVVALFALIPFLLSLVMNETNLKKSNVSVRRIMLRYRVVLVNRKYLKSCFVLTSTAGPFFAFIGFSSIAYIKYFQLSEKLFGYLFAFNALCAVLGGFIASKLIKKFEVSKIITCLFYVSIGATLLTMILGSFHYFAFALFIGVFSLVNAALRPISNAIILDQVDTDIGSATSLMLFYQFVIGAVYMSIATIDWKAPIFFYGLLSFSTMVAIFVGWKKLRFQIDI